MSSDTRVVPTIDHGSPGERVVQTESHIKGLMRMALGNGCFLDREQKEGKAILSRGAERRWITGVVPRENGKSSEFDQHVKERQSQEGCQQYTVDIELWVRQWNDGTLLKGRPEHFYSSTS